MKRPLLNTWNTGLMNPNFSLTVWRETQTYSQVLSTGMKVGPQLRLGSLWREGVIMEWMFEGDDEQG